MDAQIAKEIILRAKKAVFTGNLGNNLTAFKGDGIDFAEIKEYKFGDDVRKINWKATAKTGYLKVNVFNEERELNIVVAFLISGSVNFGTIRLKQEVMAELLALISYSAIKNGDRLNTLFFSKELEGTLKPSKNLGVVEEAVFKALSIEPIGKSFDYKSFVSYINSAIKQRSMLILIGDFLQEVDFSEIAHRHQIYALIVRDRFEEEPKLEGEYSLVDPNSLQSYDLILNRDLIKAYAKELESLDKKNFEHFLEHKIAFGKVYTDEDVYVRASQIFK